MAEAAVVPEGVDEGIYSSGGDMRWKVDSDPKLDRLFSTPYVHILRLEVYKKCCLKWEQGTAFLVDCKADNHWYYFTAGHVLFCNKPEDGHGKLAMEVKVFTSSTSTGRGELIQKLTLRDGNYSPATCRYDVKKEYKVNYSDETKRDEHDVGVIALLKDEVKPKFVKGTKLLAVPVAELEESYLNCVVAGFPFEVTVGGVKSNHNEEMFEHQWQGKVEREIAGGPVWKHRIDTTEGQSGSPLLTVDKTAVLGVHTRNNVKQRYNQAVVLTQEFVTRVESGKL